MKNTFFIFLFIFSACGLTQTRIKWAEDPVDLHYNGSEGMLTIKYLGNPKCNTLGASGKRTTGMGGRGLIIDIDSSTFFSPQTKIFSGIVYACGNPTDFPDGLKRSEMIIVKKVFVSGIGDFTLDSISQKLAVRLNLLDDKVDALGDNISFLQKKVEDMKTLIFPPREEKGVKSSSFPWLEVGIGTAAAVFVAGVAWLVLRNNSSKEGGTPPGGSTGPAFKMGIKF